MGRLRLAAAAGLCLLLVPIVSPLAVSRGRAQSSIPSPPGLEYFEFQEEAISAFLNNGRGLLLCDEMGLGKTASAIGALNSMENQWDHVLIVAPKSLLTMWQNELDRWLVDKTKTIDIASAKSGIPPCDVLLINYDIVSKFREEIDEMGVWDVLICDEAHYLKSGDALRTKAILGDTFSRTNKGAIKARRKWFLTGSPVLNNPIELYPLLRALDPSGKVIPQVKDIDDFGQHFCHKQDTPWGVTYKGGKNLSELRKRLRSGDQPLMLRRTKNEVLKELPSKRHQLLPLEDEVVAVQEEQTLREALIMTETVSSGEVDLTSFKVAELKTRLLARGLATNGRKADLIDRLRQYSLSSTRARLAETSEEASTVSGDTVEVFDSVGSALRSEAGGRRWEGLQNILKGGWMTGDRSSVVLGALAQARHATALEKVPYAIEIIENAITSSKVVVFAHHRDVQDALVEAFEDRAVILHGGSTSEERADVVQRFQKDESVRLFIGSIRAAGVGITLTAASHVLFVEFDWSPMIIQQCEDRCHRVGQESSVLVQYLFFRGTIDEHLASLLMSKQSIVGAAVDNPTGATNWAFDFGKHKGELVADVAGSDPRYLDWLVEERAYVRRDELTKALQELGYAVTSSASPKGEGHDVVSVSTKHQVRKVFPSNDRSNGVKGDKPPTTSKHGDFIMPFGKHKGKRLADIPKSYLGWLVSSGASRSNYRLNTALNGMGISDSSWENKGA